MLAAAAMTGLATAGVTTAMPNADDPVVNILMKDTGLQLSGATTVAGTVTFVVRNAGKAPHEFVVLKTGASPRRLPMSGMRARETGLIGETGTIPRGSVKKLKLRLTQGKYVLLSNLPGDYKRGLAAGLVLKAAAEVPAQQTTVEVSAFEMGYKLSTTTVPRGTVTFNVRNDGQVEHDFRLQGKGTAVLQPNESESLVVPLPKPGTFTFLCTVSGHAAAGMIGQLTVE
jgi:uncharacterized cupredoxin-like copper-binding protein